MPRQHVVGTLDPRWRRKPKTTVRYSMFFILGPFLFLYMLSVFWGHYFLARSSELGNENNVKRMQEQSNTEITLGDMSDDKGGFGSFLILISSVPRRNETLCLTIQSVIQNFPEAHILVHRHGEISCGDNKTIMPTSRLTVKEYPPHGVSNTIQKNDYLNLMEDAGNFLKNRRRNIGDDNNSRDDDSCFSHVMFLDDDVELCNHFTNSLRKASRAFPSFALGHFGRGGSGVIVPTENLEKLRENMKSKADEEKNVDKSMLEWSLRKNRSCTIRPVTIQMRHIGFRSSFLKFNWKDVDKCGAPADNVAWEAMSESASPDFFAEYCLNSPFCSPFSSNDGCKTCSHGYSGDDCGMPISKNATCTRRDNISPIVALLSGNETKQDIVLEDSNKHHLINLYVIGNQRETKWLTGNIYSTARDAHKAFKQNLKATPRWGKLAWPAETIFVHQLLSPQELWEMKYYQCTGKIK